MPFEINESYVEPADDDESIVNAICWHGATIQECAREIGCTERHVYDVLSTHFKLVSGKLDKIETVLDHN